LEDLLTTLWEQPNSVESVTEEATATPQDTNEKEELHEHIKPLHTLLVETANPGKPLKDVEEEEVTTITSKVKGGSTTVEETSSSKAHIEETNNEMQFEPEATKSTEAETGQKLGKVQEFGDLFRKVDFVKDPDVTPDKTYKVLFIGNCGVGKTSFLVRLCENKYSEGYTATLGVDFKNVKYRQNDKVLSFMLWDTAGQER
jgi:flagellar biosynthesis GTPase FlhF